MTRVLIVESSSPALAAQRRSENRSAPQNFARVFQDSNPEVHITVAEPYVQQLSKADLEGVDGVVFTGQGDPWAADDPRAAEIRDACELVFQHSLPTIGVCFGLQIATVVLGGQIVASPNGIESGIAKQIQLTDQGRAHEMMQGRAPLFAVPCGHRDEVSQMPDGATLLASKAHSQVQAMSYRAGGLEFWGTQYHPEVAPSTIAEAFREGTSMFAKAAPALADLSAVEHDADAAARLGCRVEDFAVDQRTLELTNWLKSLSSAR